MAGDIFTLDADNNAAVRTVPVNAAASETNSPVIFTTDEDGNTAVRTVSVNAGASETNSPVIFTTDEDGNAAVRVVGAGGGSAPVIDELNITPSTSAQTITAPSGTDGYSPVNVAAVTSAIDANIVAENIKKDVEILGVTGSYEASTGPNVKIINHNGEAYFGAIDLTGIQTINNFVMFKQNYQDSLFKYATGDAFLNADSLTTISGTDAFYATFSIATGITSVNLPNLTTVSGGNAFNNCFYGCTGLTNVNLPNLTTVSGQGAFGTTFSGCTNLKSIYLPKITSNSYGSRPTSLVFGSAFYLSGLEICDLRNLETVGNYGLFDNILNGTAALKKVNVNALTHIGTEAARAFMYLSSSPSSTLTDLYFPMLTTFGTNPFYTNAFANREGLTIHFRKDAQATVEALANYATLWGAGTGSSVVFDLAGTLTGADSNTYARAEKYSVYASETAGAAKIATAWRYNNTTYYIVGDSEPSVGDTIYSDSGCTQAVTTISSIA